MDYHQKYLKYKAKYLRASGICGDGRDGVKAICVIRGDRMYDRDMRISGTIYLDEMDDGCTRIYGTVVGLADGEHGFHVHESADLTQCCKSLKGHYNPFGKDHGDRVIQNKDGTVVTNHNRHVGDLGNIISTNGTATIDFTDSLIKLSGKHSVIGRSIIIHKDKDDLGQINTTESRTTGTSGDRIACGIIGLL